MKLHIGRRHVEVNYCRRGMYRCIVLQRRQLVLERSGPTEEGHFCREESYYVEEGTLYCNQFQEETDCDGRFTHRQHLRCTGLGWYKGLHLRWDRVSASQRDHRAEAAGY